jgi:membrane protein implicated in regulation of membrane protease activity
VREEPDIKTLWRNQKTEDTVTLENVHERAAKFQKRVRNRNRREYIAAVFVIAVFSWYIWILPDWYMKAGSALVIIAALFVTWQLHVRGSASRLPQDGSAMGDIDFHRRELIRQRDALKSVWLWYLAPFVPGMVLFTFGMYRHLVATGHAVHPTRFALAAAGNLLVFAIIWILNAWAARRLQRRIDELDRLRSE